MTIATINRFIRLFADAFQGLSLTVPMAEVERLAMLVHQSMDRGRRRYHVSTHLFDLCEGMSPRQVLATLFHDVVYYQLDGGFPRHADAMLKRVVRVEPNRFALRSFDGGDMPLAICSGLFGFSPGQTLSLYGGMNEFLSAMVAARYLQGYLPPEELVAVVAGIEATVPFRGPEADGREVGEALESRVREACRLVGAAVSEAGIFEIVSDAVALANRDVSSFSERDPGTFLSATWLLIEESNAPLSAAGVYSIREYRDALVRMETFLASLNPEHVFHRYRDAPGDAEFAALCDATRDNLEFATRYLGTKIAAIAIVEALAMATGGDCPVSMMLGDIRSPYGKPDRVEDFLPQPPHLQEVDMRLLAVLEAGRSRESIGDIAESPLTLFIYRCLGRDGTRDALRQARAMFAGDLPAREFLRGLDRDMGRAVARACGQIALSRREGLHALENAL